MHGGGAAAAGGGGGVRVHNPRGSTDVGGTKGRSEASPGGTGRTLTTL